ncbi:glycerol-3-phosphate dehydrogenase/oxidase [Actinocorallia sp. A-T 12471]|uniref:glycerol-3-phosphate dehydrogenase/oxidase n=1 Tax=Actinocorallia sp. A-T 12471 TaxID=3089813 RepID=UPI0029CCF5BC|nr:glycerol-3-phosphate dehydrogenase/oxidase [Actinocorallia sp. A-T 12471]MDX6740890.1 glycerol-3-phosphate dehydrogenase/oxidase [Actinocorallia sp. A-T 12471]
MSSPFTLGRFVEGPPSAGAAVDVLVIGGGITGAAVAYEAASRGLPTALVEARDFGGATSAATGKLIHGGLRYLKSLEVRLVRESLRERRILSDLAPNLIDVYPTVLPDAGPVVRFGLTAYDLLSYDRNRVADPAKRIPRHRSLGGGRMLYHDCLMISPERLTLAFVRSATARGALVANHTRADALLTEGRDVVGARVTDALTGGSREIRAKAVVNATGPWAFDTLAGSPLTDGTAGAPPSVRSEGVYLITRRLTDLMTLHVTPHGHFSAAPWRGHSMIGPTERAYRGAVSDWRLTRESVEEFLAGINAAGLLPVRLGLDDVVHAYGGLRPLTGDAGDDTYAASRAAEVIDHAERGGVGGLVTAAGGKYTTSRAFAEHVVDLAARKAGRATRPGRTDATPLHGCGTGPIEPYVAASLARNADFSPETVRYLARHHGTEHDAVLDLARADPSLAEPLDADGELPAQVLVAVRHESARTLADVVLRRTGLGTLGHPGGAVLEAVAAVAAAELGWSAARRDAELHEADRLLTLPW